MPDNRAHRTPDEISERDDAVVLRLDGDLDLATAANTWMLVNAAHRAAAVAAHRTLVIDLSAVTFLASVGLEMLATLHARTTGHLDAAPATAVDLRLVITTRTVARPLELTGLDRVLAVYPTLAAAFSCRDRT